MSSVVERPSTAEDTSQCPADALAALVRVSKWFGTVPVFESFNLTVGPGEIVVVVGPSGSGKSTLLRILLGLEAPDGGEAWLLGRRIDTLTSRQRATMLREVGVGFQDPLLDNARTVLENLVALARVNRRFDEGNSDDLARLKSVVDGFDLSDLLERQSSMLSGGQKLRVALGRALVAQPRLLLLDEPTHMVDPAGKAGIYRELGRLIRGKGLSALIVSHDDEARSISDRVVEVASQQPLTRHRHGTKYRQNTTEGVALNWVPRTAPEPPSAEIFSIGSVSFAEGPDPVSLGISSDRHPSQITSAVIRDCYVEAWSIDDQADMVAIEAELDRHARERRIAGAWERKPGTAYTLDGADVPAEAPSEWGDPVASERFWRLMASPGCDAWRRSLVPSAAALLYLADPWHTNHVVTPAGSVPLDHSARRGFSLVTDAIAIRSRASVMAELVKESMLSHPNAMELGGLRWLSVACGTALPAMKAAVYAGIRPQLLLADFDKLALAQAERLAERVDFRGQVKTRRMNIFDVARMDALGSELARNDALPHLIDLMGIFEYTGPHLGVDPVGFLGSVFRLLRPGGALILGQMLDSRPVPDFTMGVVPWPYVEMRSLDELLTITTAAGLPASHTEVYLPSDGVYAVLRATKPS